MTESKPGPRGASERAGAKERARVAVFATARWGDEVLEVARAAPGDAISIGSVRGARSLPRAASMLEEPAIVARACRDAVWLEVPAGLGADLMRAGASAAVALRAPARVALALGDRAELRAASMVVAIEVVSALAPAPAGRRARGSAWGHVAAAALLHAFVLGAARHGAEAAEALDERAPEIAGLQAAIARAERRASVADAVVFDDGSGKSDGRAANDRDGNGRPAGGARAEGEAGRMGTSSRTAAGGRYAVPRRDDVPARLSRDEALTDARTFGAIGLLAQGPSSPTARFGDVEASGRDAAAADGAMWGRRMEDAAGAGGLGLTGIGLGGGGGAEGIGLGRVGGLGHSSGPPGDGTGGRGTIGVGLTGFGWGGSGDRLAGHRTRTPWARYTCCGTSVSGRLPPEAIQRIIRQNFGRFRACYETALRDNPTLAGRVSTRFVIGRSGAVESAADGGSTLPSPKVVACVVQAFRTLSFPQPEGGIVTVTYPILFSPG